MRTTRHPTARHLGAFLGIAAFSVAVMLAFDVYATPGFALSASLMKLCGL